MAKLKTKRSKTASFICEIPLRVSPKNEAVLLSRFEAGRQLYNACLGESMRRLNLIKQSKIYQYAKLLKKDDPGRKALFKEVREKYQYSEYALHSYATHVRHSWISEHIDSNTAQKLATRAFQASVRVMFGRAKRVRFKGKNQIDSLEGKNNTTEIRWKDEKVIWSGIDLEPLIQRNDPVILHGLSSRVKYVRLVRRKRGKKNFFYAQIVCEGVPLRKPKNVLGKGTVGLDLGPSTISIVGEDTARLLLFAAQLKISVRKIRRIQRQIDRQRRANNPDNYNENGTVKKGKRNWNKSNRQHKKEARLTNLHRQTAAYRKSLHGQLVNEILTLGNTFKLEKIYYKGWQKIFGRSVGNRAPGMFVEHLKRKAESAGGGVHEFPTLTTALSQTCQCGRKAKKRLSERVHKCECGIVAQRDLYSAFLARFVDENNLLQADLAELAWSGVEPLLWTAWQQAPETNLRVAGLVPTSFGRCPESEQIVPEVLKVVAKNLDAVAPRGESQVKAIGLLEPPGF